MGWRLCMSLLLGSSLSTRFTMIFSSLGRHGTSAVTTAKVYAKSGQHYRSVNHPFLPRNQLAV